ncbi:jg2673, partial [Pararge aegeria aegeria]
PCQIRHYEVGIACLQLKDRYGWLNRKLMHIKRSRNN